MAKIWRFAVAFFLVGAGVGALISSWLLLPTAEFSRSCAPQAKEISTTLLVLVLSSTKGIERRQAIRETWASQQSEYYPRGKVLVKFVLGLAGASPEAVRELHLEHIRFGDLALLHQVNDSYERLTEKVKAAFVWADATFEFKYVLKVDDDSFARLDRIVAELEQSPVPNLYWGYFDGRAEVFKTGKWKEPKWFLCDRYLPYAVGGGYVLSFSLVSHIAAIANILDHYNSEVFVIVT